MYIEKLDLYNINERWENLINVIDEVQWTIISEKAQFESCIARPGFMTKKKC